jgi:hypothetical protein
MNVSNSTLDRVALGCARALLHPPVDRERLWPALAAAACAAVSALAFAYAMVMAPPTLSRHVVQIDPTIAAAKSLSSVKLSVLRP